MQCNALKIKTSLVFFICGTITNLQIVLNTPKNPYLNQATQKNTCQNFPTPKKSRNRKFQTQNNPSIIPVTWNPEYPPGVLKRTVVLLVTFKVKVSRITSVNGTHQRKKQWWCLYSDASHSTKRFLKGPHLKWRSVRKLSSKMRERRMRAARHWVRQKARRRRNRSLWCRRRNTEKLREEDLGPGIFTICLRTLCSSLSVNSERQC